VSGSKLGSALLAHQHSENYLFCLHIMRPNSNYGSDNNRSFSDYFGSSNGRRGDSRGSSNSSRGGFRRGGRSGGRGGRNMGPAIAHHKFIAKAVPTEIEKYSPEHSFEDFNVDNRIKAQIVACGYTHPSEIQDKAISHVIEGRDVVGISATGTGKTAAFLIPLIDKVLKTKGQAPKVKEVEPEIKIEAEPSQYDRGERRGDRRDFRRDFRRDVRKPTSEYNGFVLVVAPTRELALQIEEELLKLTTKEMWIFSTACIGGSDIGRQMSRLHRPNQFIIGTPGRLLDLIEKGVIDLDDCHTIVLDEVDRMLDMGFVEDIQYLISRLPKEKQSLFFSATVEPKIRLIMDALLRNPVTIAIKSQGASANVDQDVVKVHRGESKVDILKDLLKQEGFDKVLIFTRTKHEAERLSQDLYHDGFRTESIHGDKSQGFRKRALDRFKASQVQVLVATDVAARGIDVNDISHVINYDAPDTYETYIHRIGRTGRAGKFGFALTFVDA
jgi:ATP-dependent RNA helicase RhlE